MGSAVSSISNAVSNVVSAPGNYIGDRIGGQVGDAVRRVGPAITGQSIGAGMLVGDTAKGIGDMFNQPAPPPGSINPTLEGVRDSQIAQAKDFRQNMPQLAQNLTSNLKQNVNQQLGQNLTATNEKNAARGLLYGGLNQSQQQQNYGRAAAQTASGVSDINSGLQSAASQLDANAVGTGTGIQQSSQDIQNQIYQQTMAQINANNSMMGSAAGFGLLAAIV